MWASQCAILLLNIGVVNFIWGPQGGRLLADPQSEVCPPPGALEPPVELIRAYIFVVQVHLLGKMYSV